MHLNFRKTEKLGEEDNVCLSCLPTDPCKIGRPVGHMTATGPGTGN